MIFAGLGIFVGANANQKRLGGILLDIDLVHESQNRIGPPFDMLGEAIIVGVISEFNITDRRNADIGSGNHRRRLLQSGHRRHDAHIGKISSFGKDDDLGVFAFVTS